MARPSEYNPKFHDPWGWSLAIRGATDEEIAEAFGVTRQTIDNWRKNSETFAEALNVGKDDVDARVEQSLYKKATGYELTDTEIIRERSPSGEVLKERQVMTKKEVAPDTMAIMYWLNNRKRLTGEWKQRQEVELSGGVANTDLSSLTDEDLIAIAQYAKNGGESAPEAPQKAQRAPKKKAPTKGRDDGDAE